MPIMQIFYIRDAINPTARLQQKSAFTQESKINYPLSFIFLFEVGVRETKEHFIYRREPEIIAHMPHGVCSKDSYVITRLL